MQRITVKNATNAEVIGAEIDLANTFSSRLVGLLGRKRLDQGHGVLIEPSSGVHTFGMRFAIDVVALDGERRVIGTWSNVPPWRIAGLSLKTHSCLELAAGQVEMCGIQPGDCLEIARTADDNALQPENL